MLYSSTCVSPDFIVRRHLHHLTYMPSESLFYYIPDVYLMQLSPSSRVSYTYVLPYCAPVPTELHKRSSQEPCFSWSDVCVLIGGGRCCCSVRVIAQHCLRPSMFRFGFSTHLQPCPFQFQEAVFCLSGEPHLLWSGAPYLFLDK